MRIVKALLLVICLFLFFFAKAQDNSLSKEIIVLDSCDFGEARISNLIFENILFNCDVKFLTGQIIDSLSSNFNHAIFNFESSFRMVIFNAETEFRKVDFREKADFRSARFNDAAFFVSPIFHQDVDFEYVEFRDDIYFDGTAFTTKANFFGAKFEKKVSFFQVTLPDLLNFEDISTQEIIDLTKTKIRSDNDSINDQQFCYINLIDAPIDKIKMRYEKFRIYRPDTITPAVFEQLTNVYGGLLKNFKDNGYLESYKRLDIEYQEFKFNNKPSRNQLQKISGSFFNWLNKNWNNYGYDKSRIWFITLLFFVIFSFINWLIFKNLITKVYPLDSFLNAYKKSSSTKQFGSNLALNLYYTALIFFGFNLKIEKLNFNYPIYIALIFIQYTIGLVCVAYLTNFVISSNLIGG